MAKDKSKVKYVDYFNPTEVRYTFTMPDKMSSITLRKLTEGDWANFQSKRDTVEMDQASKIMRMEMGGGKMRMEILEMIIVDWDIRTLENNEFVRVPFESKNIKKLLENLDPVIVQSMYDLVVEYNPFLRGEKKSIKQLEKQLESIQTELDKKKTEAKKN